MYVNPIATLGPTFATTANRRSQKKCGTDRYKHDTEHPGERRKLVFMSFDSSLTDSTHDNHQKLSHMHTKSCDIHHVF
jgi:hypothetical protein